MFLKWGALILFFTSVASAALPLEPGSYGLIKGSKDLCATSISLTEKELSQKVINLSASYSYLTYDSATSTPSDLDPKCVFEEKTSRTEENGSEILLVRMNKELCQGKVRSVTNSKAVLGRKEIRITHQVDNAPPYECLWKKK